MPTEYTDAPTVRRIAEKLIGQYHPHLHGCRVEYLFVNKYDKDGVRQPVESKGKQRWGQAVKVSGRNAYLASAEKNTGDPADLEFFVVEICAYAWQFLDEKQKEALVDHELCHLALDEDKGKGTPTMRPHDVEEFSEIVKRHGLWRPDLEQMVKIGAEQLKLDLQPADKSKPARAEKSKRANGAAAHRS
jgi:hypothetical protein